MVKELTWVGQEAYVNGILVGYVKGRTDGLCFIRLSGIFSNGFFEGSLYPTIDAAKRAIEREYENTLLDIFKTYFDKNAVIATLRKEKIQNYLNDDNGEA